MAKFDVVTRIHKSDPKVLYYLSKGANGQARRLFLDTLSEGQRNWVERRPWRIVRAYHQFNDVIELSVRTDRSENAEHDHMLASLLFSEHLNTR